MAVLSVHRRGGSRRRVGATTAKVIVVVDTVLRPVLIAGAILVAAVAWSSPAQAEPVGGSYTDVLGSTGITGVTGSGTITNAIAQVGQALCPLLVQPGSGLASNALAAGGNGGLVSSVGGAVAGMVIQSQCPNAMAQLANGNVAPLMQLLGMSNAALPAGLPATGAIPPNFGIPPAAATNPLQLAGLS